MQIGRIDNTSVNFGVSCPPSLKARISACVPNMEFIPIFRNGEMLAERIETIGSPNTRLTGFRIKRFIRDNFSDGENGIVDKCFLKFKMKNAAGGSETVSAGISSADAATGSSPDIYKDFVQVVKKTERTFLQGYMERLANKGKLNGTAIDTLSDLYPKHEKFISTLSQELEDLNEMAKARKGDGFFAKIADFILK